jgi:hypothetical protein
MGMRKCSNSTMGNDYEIRGETVVLFLKRRNGNHIEALVDVADLPKVQSFPGVWYANWNKRGRMFRVKGTTRKYSEMGRKMVYFSRFLLDAPKGLEVDHINHDPLDNRRRNLRLVDRGGNGQNRRGATKRSKTGIRGVFWCKEQGKWRAQIEINHRTCHIGYFDNLADAENAAIAARATYMPYSSEAFQIGGGDNGRRANPDSE